MNTKLNGKANTSHNHAASNITSGTLPVARGGTGVTSIDALKNVLGISSIQIQELNTSLEVSSYNGSETVTVPIDGIINYVLLSSILYKGASGSYINYRICTQCEYYRDSRYGDEYCIPKINIFKPGMSAQISQ